MELALSSNDSAPDRPFFWTAGLVVVTRVATAASSASFLEQRFLLLTERASSRKSSVCGGSSGLAGFGDLTSTGVNPSRQFSTENCTCTDDLSPEFICEVLDFHNFVRAQ